MARSPPFLWLGNIPLCFCVCMCEREREIERGTSVDGHLGCCHILAGVNNATINMGVHISFQISVFISLGKY